MNDMYFKKNENFENIIKNCLKDEQIEDMILIATGWTNIVYEVETNSGNYFFRFPRDEFWSRAIVKDYEFSKYIYKKTDFNTCQLQLKYDNNRPFSIHKKIIGTPLAEKMNKLSQQEIEKVSTEIAKFMDELHKINFQKEEIFDISNIGLNLREFLNELLEKHVDKENRAFWKFEDTVNEPICLVHGDLNSSNIILDENNKITGIIDFGFAGFGNKYDDIARIIGRCPEDFKQKIINSYENISQSKIDKEILDYKITEWENIDQAYINYMRGIGIYE